MMWSGHWVDSRVLPAHDPFSAEVVPEGREFAHVMFHGALDVADCRRAEAALRRAERETHGTVLLDLCDLRSICPGGVAVLTEGNRRLGERLIVVRGSEAVQRALAVCPPDGLGLRFVD
jgi:hypothetical protein